MAILSFDNEHSWRGNTPPSKRVVLRNLKRLLYAAYVMKFGKWMIISMK